MEERCCPTEAGASSEPYAPLGTLRALTADAALLCYVTGGPLGERAILAVPDIFGLAVPASLRALDELAAASGLPVVAPDYFRGQPWRLEDFPPRPGQSVVEWLGRTVPAEAVRRDTEAVLGALLRESGTRRVGAVGFCWGGGAALAAAAAGLLRCAAAAHPSFVGPAEARAAAAAGPLCLLPSRDEDAAQWEQIAAALAGRPGCLVRRFPEAPHGWCAARADFVPGSPGLRDLREALRVLATFFQEHV